MAHNAQVKFANIGIIGAGIGGLVFALCLRKLGFNATIFERTQAIKPVGAGIIIAVNGMKVMRWLGLADKVRAAGVPLKRMCVETAVGKTLSSIDLESLQRQYQDTSVALSRAALHDILVEALGQETLNLKAKLTRLELQENSVWAQFESGEQRAFDLIVGADGIHSVCREFVLGNVPLRDSGQVCWRALTRVNQNLLAKLPAPGSFVEIWNGALRIGLGLINDDTVYWFAVSSRVVDFERGSFLKSAQLVELFSNCGYGIPELLAATPDEHIIFAPLKDLKPQKRWYRSGVVLLGDAIHATTPNMGQGANMAIESAWTLAQLLSKSHNLDDTFRRYEKYRQKRTSMITNTSRLIGKMAHVSNPILSLLRNSLFLLASQSSQDRQAKKLFDFSTEDVR